ncbi:hypothetical protein [Paeniglutamicibacter kerguelensis]|uniref:DUF389 domain-containing protein n=1 Tax=Paeniglutamicibacter kerguelensis TaxID=254788 RepID=A0ABS4XJV0_9MICC|nr:hypothetical protein [Paeniglutamicibacter kerguelensis]MBP2388747.1 hypothetical protein [Paeniglutamicibacter kerguelensis]
MLAIAIGGSLVGGQQDMMLLFGTVLGSMFLAATLAFIAIGAPFTLFAALLLAPYVVSMFVPNFSPVFLTRFLCTFVGWVLGSMLRSEWDRQRGRGEPALKRSCQEAGDSLEWRVGRKIFREAGFSEQALVAKIRSLVSATRGEACLTVAGNAQGALVVWFSPEPSKEDRWGMLTTPGSDLGQVDVKIGHMVISHASWETTTLEQALIAARYFHRMGRADPQLTWFNSPTIADWRTLSA